MCHVVVLCKCLKMTTGIESQDKNQLLQMKNIWQNLPIGFFTEIDFFSNRRQPPPNVMMATMIGLNIRKIFFFRISFVYPQ
jgi:hypothetical protein